MANPTKGFGLQFSRRLDAAALSAQLVTRRLAYNTASAIYDGDLVQALASGYIERWTAGDSAATLGGVFRGCKYLDPAVGYSRWYNAWTAPTLPSSTIVEAYIEVDPNVIYTIRSSGGSGPVGIADVGYNFEVTMTAGNALTGISAMTLDATSGATTATLPLRVVGVYSGVNSSFNDPDLVNNVVEVKLNNAQMFQTTGL